MNVYDAIKQERDYQNEKWGKHNDDFNTINDWIAFITDYSGRARVNNPRGQLIKVAALAVAAIETYDRNNGFPE